LLGECADGDHEQKRECTEHDVPRVGRSVMSTGKPNEQPTAFVPSYSMGEFSST
jgi:hypothetical protein